MQDFVTPSKLPFMAGCSSCHIWEVFTYDRIGCLFLFRKHKEICGAFQKCICLCVSADRAVDSLGYIQLKPKLKVHGYGGMNHMGSRSVHKYLRPPHLECIQQDQASHFTRFPSCPGQSYLKSSSTPLFASSLHLPKMKQKSGI